MLFFYFNILFLMKNVRLSFYLIWIINCLPLRRMYVYVAKCVRFGIEKEQIKYEMRV